MDLDPRIEPLYEMVQELQDQMSRVWIELEKVKESIKNQEVRK